MAAGGGRAADSLSSAGVPCAFSPHSQAFFALASADGHLRVWETANNRLHQEYVPSAHLSGTCTCLAWAPTRLQAKVKRAGRRGLGVRPGSARLPPEPHGPPPRASRGPREPGAWRQGVWRRRRGLGPAAPVPGGLSGGQRLSARPDPTGSGPESCRRAARGLRPLPAVSGAAMFAAARAPPAARPRLTGCDLPSPGF